MTLAKKTSSASGHMPAANSSLVPPMIVDGAPLPELRGTLTVLMDSGYDDESALRWLFTPDESLPGAPVDALLAGRKTEVRRRAQALAF